MDIDGIMKVIKKLLLTKSMQESSNKLRNLQNLIIFVITLNTRQKSQRNRHKSSVYLITHKPEPLFSLDAAAARALIKPQTARVDDAGPQVDDQTAEALPVVDVAARQPVQKLAAGELTPAQRAVADARIPTTGLDVAVSTMLHYHAPLRMDQVHLQAGDVTAYVHEADVTPVILLAYAVQEVRVQPVGGLRMVRGVLTDALDDHRGVHPDFEFILAEAFPYAAVVSCL